MISKETYKESTVNNSVFFSLEQRKDLNTRLMMDKVIPYSYVWFHQIITHFNPDLD